MSLIKLNPCEACGVIPRMQKIQILDGKGVMSAGSRREWWYQVECRGFHHTLTVRHRDKESAGSLWNTFNKREKHDT